MKNPRPMFPQLTADEAGRLDDVLFGSLVALTCEADFDDEIMYAEIVDVRRTLRREHPVMKRAENMFRLDHEGRQR